MPASLKGKLHNEVLVLRRIALAVFFVRTNCDVAVNRAPILKHRSYPLLEGSQFQLTRAPSGLWGRQKVVVLLEPKVEVSIRIQPQDGLSQKPFELDQELVNLGQFLTSIGKEVVDIELRVVLAHVYG